MLLENHNAIESGGYQISNSLRFQASSSSYLSRTPASASNRKTWTWSGWVKVGSLSTSQQCLFGHINNTGANQHTIYFVNNTIEYRYYASAMIGQRTTTQVFRDPSAWYHIVAVWDTTQVTAGDRMKLYINGVQVTAFSATVNPTQNTDGIINNTVLTEIGGASQTASGYFDGYQTEVNFIDGVSLTPSSFGEFDSLTGQWVAKKYTGSYGTNGFYLPFSNGTSTTTLGNDGSGNANHWTLTNFTRSPGTTDCWMYDVPSGNSNASGTQPSSNYCTLNPLDNGGASYVTASNGNLSFSASGGVAPTIRSTIGVSSGKYYWETIYLSGNTDIGVSLSTATITGELGSQTGGYSYLEDGRKYTSGSASAYGATYTINDVIGIALDMDAGTITFYKNNVSQGVAFTGVTGIAFPALSKRGASAATLAINFGQRSFVYSPPSGFKALCTANLPTATIKNGNTVFDAKLWSGNGTARSITGYNFSPDFVWIKGRSTATLNMLCDAVRGVNKQLASDATNAEFTYTDQLTAFNSDGFSLGVDTSTGWCNYNDGRTYVGWAWDAGSSTVSNSSGTIASQVRANPTAGVSVVTYTGTGSNATVGHGLGVAPKMVIIKSRSSGTGNWPVYHASFGNGGCTYLNATNAGNASATLYNNTSPTSSVFTINTATDLNQNTGTFVAYCFAEITGYSRFGSYTGNGSADGSFVYCGFRPKYVLMKCSSTTGSWEIIDTSRSAYNASISVLDANTANAEVNVSTYGIDILSNGFKLRTADATINGSGSTYIFACFAESPFQNSNAR